MVYKSSKSIGNGGAGTITEIDTGAGLTGGPITISGTISIADNVPNSLAGFDNTGEFSDVAVSTGLSLTAGSLTATGLARTLTSSHVFVGNASNIASDVAMSGDAAISNTGAITVAHAPASGITGTTLASGVVTSSLTTVGTIATGTWQGTKIGLAYGGTNADLSATGGASNVLKQVTAGATITVGQLAASDLSNGTTGTGAVVLASGSISGNATTATALQAARNINGVSFNGTADITVTSAAGTLTGTVLASNIVTSSLTSVGTLTNLTLSGALTMGVNSITGTGSLGATGARFTKGWFTDLESTNAATIGGVAASGTGGGYARTISPAFTTPNIGAAVATSLAFSNTATGGIVGTVTNDDAAVGYVGEYIESDIPMASAISVTSATPANITTISLSAGDWDVWGSIATSPAASTTTSVIGGAISTTTASFPIQATNKGGLVFAQTVVTAGNYSAYPIGVTRLKLPSTTTIYLVGRISFSVSTMAAYGFIAARRVR